MFWFAVLGAKLADGCGAGTGVVGDVASTVLP
jgi:hypothetical protein